MPSIRLATFVLVLAMTAPAVSYAADVPQTTGTFVQYCSDKSNWSACDNAMLTDETATLITMLSNNTANECDLPDGIKATDANAQIVAWLAQNKGYDDAPIHDGIQAAIKGLWNCATKLNTGMTSSGAPDKIGAFMGFCADKANYNTCASEIVTGDVSVMASSLSGPSNRCPSPDNTTTEELTDKTLAWLRANPQPDEEDTSDAIMKAHDALWPCQ